MMNDVRAKEAWEMDRIWKGRSMSINQEGSNVIASPMSTGADLDRREDPYHNSTTHGSSRTYFVVQTTQGQSTPFRSTERGCILFDVPTEHERIQS
jgi:hypothetical protein